MTLEQFNNCKQAPPELVEMVKKQIDAICGDFDESDGMEEAFGFNFNGVDYDVKVVDEDTWEDGGKYQYGGTTYQLVSYDKTIVNYCCEKSIIDRFDIVIYRPCSRSGSYFSDYYYQYHTPTVSRVVVKHILEQIIPAHDEIGYEEV